MQCARAQSPNLKRGGSEPNLPEKWSVVPQPTQALTGFVKHVADPLVDKGWNLHLKIGKGEPQKEEFIQGTAPSKTSAKTVDKEKVHSLPREKQTPLEMGTGGGGRGKRAGGGKRPPEDRIEFEDHLKKDDDEDDSSTETSFELEVTPEQLASVNPNRTILRLQLSPRKRVASAAPGGGGSPPPGGITETQPPERPGHGRPVQPLGSGEGLPWPLEGAGGGGLPQPPEGSGRPPRHSGGGGVPPPDGNGNGGGNGNENGGGGGKPPTRRGGNGGGNGDGDGDGGGDSPILLV